MYLYQNEARNERTEARVRGNRRPAPKWRLPRWALGLAMIAGISVAADAQDRQTAQALEKFQGTWVLVEGEVDGRKIKDDDVRRSEIVNRGNEATLKMPHVSDEVIRSKARKVSPGKEPKEIEWVRETGPNKGQAVVAIYEFIGDDQFKVCYHPAGKTKPEQFDTKEGSGHILHVWKRVKYDLRKSDIRSRQVP